MNTTQASNGAAKKTSLVEKVYPELKLAIISEKRVIATLRKFGVATDDLDKADLVLSLASTFETKVKAAGGDPAKDLSACPECQAPSTEDLEECPYCGEAFGEPEDTEAAETKADADEEEEDEAEDEEEDVEEDAEDEEEEEEPVKKTAKASAAKKTTSKKAAAVVPIVAESELDVSSKPRASKTSSGGEIVGTVDDQGRTIVHVKGAAAGKLATKDLDKAVSDVKKLRANSVTGLFALGLKLKEIVDKGLWKLRMKDDGKTARWATFDAFSNSELNIARGEAYNHIRMVDKFTEEQVKELSVSKISLMLKVPDSLQEKMLEEAKATPVRELRDKVKQANESVPEEERATNRSERAKAGAKGGKKKASKVAAKKSTAAAAAPESKITIASILEKKQKILLRAKPKGGFKGVTWEDLKPAKRIADMPIGRLVLQNDVSIWFELKMGPKGFELIAEAKRDG